MTAIAASALVLVAASCSDDDAGPYVVSVGAGQCSMYEIAGVYITINGERVPAVLDEFPGFDDAEGVSYVIESRIDETVLDRVEVFPGFCDNICGAPPWREESISYLIAPGGRLAFGSAYCNGCNADSFCPGGDIDCYAVQQIGCTDPATPRCGLLSPHADPTLGYITCVPDGDVPLGMPCTIGPDSTDTGYDDCEPGAVCIDTTCRAFCSEQQPCEAGTCTYELPGQPGAGHSHNYGYCIP